MPDDPSHSHCDQSPFQAVVQGGAQASLGSVSKAPVTKGPSDLAGCLSPLLEVTLAGILSGMSLRLCRAVQRVSSAISQRLPSFSWEKYQGAGAS